VPLQNNSNLPSIQRVKYEDYKGAPDWFAQFLNTLNLYLTAAYNIFNGGITYSNLGVIQPFTFTFTPGSTAGFKFANPLIQAPQNVIIGNVYITGDTSSHPTGAVTLFWHYANGFIFVDAIPGLTNGTNYTLSVTIQ
jgi:hypothetical protein